MRLLGAASSLMMFRWDLLYLFAQLTTDERPGVSDLAAPVDAAMGILDARRAGFEQAQAALVVAVALVAKRDKGRDRLIVEMGGIARATERDTYARFFPKYSPSQTAKLGIDAETAEVTRILGEMKGLDAAHPLRIGYEASLTDAQNALAQSKAKADDAELALALERSQVQRCKWELDKVRLETHGKLVALLTDKAEADAFFRPTAAAPGEKKESEGEGTGG